MSAAPIERSSGQPASSMRRAGARGVVLGLAGLGRPVDDPQPAGGAVALVGKADAPGVDEAHAADGAVVALVRVAGDDERRVDTGERRLPALGRRDAGEHLLVAARGRVAVQDAVELDGEGEGRERRGAIGAELARGEPRGAQHHVVGRRLGRADGVGHLALAVAADEVDGCVERLDAVEHVARERARDSVAADDDGVRRAVEVGEDGVERLAVAVQVVEREDDHRRGNGSATRWLHDGSGPSASLAARA